ncbi:MAG: alpha/beta hydrolase [Lachnospiraceae bacterium]|nr:alpha/beta hydrolase [Lachnospiraceae bacterium]
MSKPWENRSFYFGEDNFKECMTAKVAPLISRFCMEGYLRLGEHRKLHYHYFIHPKARGTIVICHGFCEGFFKYHEVMYYFYQAGYSVFLPEMRGHGYSTREVENRCMVHVDDFMDYVEDLRVFLDEVVIPTTNHKKLILFSHSMGGCVASLFLEEYPDYFAKAILSSPMLGMQWSGTHPILVKLLLWWSLLMHWTTRYMPGQRDFVPVSPYPNCSAQSRERYEYQFHLRMAHLEYRTNGGDYCWGRAADKAMKQAIRNARQIRIPTILFSAGEDALVSPEGQQKFLKRNPTVVYRSFPHARHEIFNANEEDRIAYYLELFRFVEEA